LQGNLPAPQISTPSKQDSTLNNILAKSTLTPEEYEKITQELLHRVSETPVKEPRQPSQPFPFSTPASAKKPMAVHSTPVTTIDVGKLIMDKSSPARSKMIQQQHQAKKQLPKFSDTFKVTGSAFNLPLPPQPEVSVTPWTPSRTPSRRQHPATPSASTPAPQFKTPQPYSIQQQTPSRLEVVSNMPKTSWRDFNVQFTPDVQAKAASENEELRQIPNSRKRRHPTDENLQPEDEDIQYRPVKRRALDSTPMPSTPRTSLSSSGVFTTPSSVPTSVTARKILQTIGRITSPVSDASEPIYRASGYANSPMGSLTGSAKRKRSDLKARTPRVKVSAPMFTEEDEEIEDAPPSDSLTSDYDTRVKRATIPAARVSSARKIFKVKRTRMEESSDEDYSFEQAPEPVSKPKQQEPAPKKSFEAVEVLSSDDESSSEEDKPLRKKQKSDASVEKPAEKVEFKLQGSKAPTTKTPTNGFGDYEFDKPSEKQSAVAKEKKDEPISTPFVFNASMKDKNDSFYTDEYQFKQPEVSTDKKFTSATTFPTTMKFGENAVSVNDDGTKKEEPKKEEPKKTEAPKEAPKSLFTFTPEKTSGTPKLDFMKEPEVVPSTLSFNFTSDKTEATSIASGFTLTPKVDDAKPFSGFTLPTDTKKTEKSPEKEKEKPFSSFVMPTFGDKKETEKEKEKESALGFSFGTETKTDTPSLGFSMFSTDKKTDSPSLSFNFTDKKEETKEKEDKPSSLGFSFGKDESKDKAPTLGFSFTPTPAKEEVKETPKEKTEEKKKDEPVSTPFVFNASMKDKNDSFYTDEYQFKQPEVSTDKKFTSETTFPTTVKFGENAVSVNDDGTKKEEPKKEEPKKEEKKEEKKETTAGFSFTPTPAASDKKETEKESTTGFTGFSFAPSTPAEPAKTEEKKPEEKKEDATTGFGFNFTPAGNAFKFGNDAKTEEKKPEEKKPEAAASTLFGTSTPASSWNPTPAAPSTGFKMQNDEDSMADDDVKPAASTPAPSTGATGFGFNSISTPFGTPVTAAPMSSGTSGFSFTLEAPKPVAASTPSSGAPPPIFMFGDDSKSSSTPSSTPAPFGQSAPAATPFNTPFGALPSTTFGNTAVTFSAPSPTFGQPAQSPTGFNPTPSSNAPFGSSTPSFGNNTPSNAPFGSGTPFGSSNAPFGSGAPTPFGSTPAFGSNTPSTPAFGATQFGGGATPAFGSSAPSAPAFGATPFGGGATNAPFSGTFGGGNAAANPFAVSNPAAPSGGGYDMFANNSSHVADDEDIRRRKIVKARTQKKFQNN
jgi:hypothetical protein